MAAHQRGDHLAVFPVIVVNRDRADCCVGNRGDGQWGSLAEWLGRNRSYSPGRTPAGTEKPRLAEIGVVGQLFAVHALTVGAIGGMTIGMMTRTARAHTGRPLSADGFEI